MLPFILSWAATWLTAQVVLKLRPKRSSSVIFVPIFLIAAIAGYLSALVLILGGTGATAPSITAVSFGAILSSVLLGSMTVWSGAKEHDRQEALKLERIRSRAEDDRIKEEEERKASGDDPRFDSYPAASIAIRHRPDVTPVWVSVDSLGEGWASRFLDALEADPKASPVNLANAIGAEMKEAYPFENSSLAKAYLSLKTYGRPAEQEFRAAIYALGDMVNPADVAQNIMEKASAR